MKYRINLIKLDVNRWVFDSREISFSVFLIIDETEKNVEMDSSVLKPGEMVEEFLIKLRAAIGQELMTEKEEEEPEIEFNNEGYLRQKLFGYFRKINNEIRNNKDKRNQRNIRSNHLDIYDEATDISFLPKNIQFYIVLNWCKKFYEREEYKKAIDPLRRLLKLNPQFGLGYKWLARSLKKVRKYDEAMRFYQKYTEVDGSIDSLLDLAKSFRKGKIFVKSEEIYLQILEKEPQNKEARIGVAQIKYALKKDDYLEILDELYQEDPAWLKNWLIDEFNFRIYIPEKAFITPIQAAKLLGFEKVFELTQRAFKNDLPSHFNPTKARMSFYREELENWANVMNRFQCLEKEIQLHSEKVRADTVRANMRETAETETQKSSSAKKTDEPSPTRIEEILKQIRERKALRQALQAEESQVNSRNEKKESHRNSKVKSQSKAASGKTKKEEPSFSKDDEANNGSGHRKILSKKTEKLNI